MSTREKVIKILTELSGREEICPEDSVQKDVGLDSFGMVAMLIKLEECFGIELKESDMNPFDLSTVSDVIALAERYTGGKI
jgi:acyl carrier protein